MSAMPAPTRNAPVLRALVCSAVLAGIGTAARAEPPPFTHVVEDARVTRVSDDHPVIRRHTLCVEHPLPAAGFDPVHVDIRLRREPPDYLELLLKPVLQDDGRVCAYFASAVAAEADYTIEIRDMRQFFNQFLYYSGPLLTIPEKK